MKINWGTAIVIVMALFMGFILFFVFKAATQNANETDLVTEEYYKKEQTLQNDIYAMENAVNMEIPLTVSTSKEGIEITFPDDMKNGDVKGTFYLYRPSNKKLDFEIPIKIENGKAFVPSDNLLAGRWDITAQWNFKGKEYLVKKSLSL